MMKTQINEESISAPYLARLENIDKKCEKAITGRSATLMLDNAWLLDGIYQDITRGALEWKNYHILLDNGKTLIISLPIEGVKLMNSVQRPRVFGKPNLKYGYEGHWLDPDRLLFNLTMLTVLGHVQRREDFLKKNDGRVSHPKSWEIHESQSRIESEYTPR